MPDKLFGEYLLQHEIVAPRALVEALMEQYRVSPPVARIVYEKGLLGDVELFKAMAYHYRTGVSFQRACEELGYWSAELETQVREELNKHRVPLGQVLLKNKAITFERLREALDNYMRETGSEEKSAGHAALEAAPSRETIAEPAGPRNGGRETLREADLSGEPRFSAIDPASAVHYGEIFHRSKRDRVESLVLSWETALSRKDTVALAGALANVQRAYGTLRSSARVTKAEITFRIMSGLRDLLQLVRGREAELSPAELQRLTSVNLQGLDLAWELREAVCQHRSERSIWDDPRWQDRYHGFEVHLSEVMKFFEGTPAPGGGRLQEAS